LRRGTAAAMAFVLILERTLPQREISQEKACNSHLNRYINDNVSAG
jgi:hypothetical protein